MVIVIHSVKHYFCYIRLCIVVDFFIMILCNRISYRPFPFYLISALLMHVHLSLSWGNTYLSDNLEWNRNCQDVLTYIGYGQGGNDSDYCISVDDKRRACQSRLLKVQGPIIMSQPYHACLDITSATMWTLYPRKAFAYESIARPAMSGGATLLNDAFVGLNVRRKLHIFLMINQRVARPWLISG